MISLTRSPTITNVEESWNQMKDMIHKAVSVTVGVTKPGKRYINRDIWNDDVEMKFHEKKRLYHKLSPDRAITKIFTIN